MGTHCSGRRLKRFSAFPNRDIDQCELGIRRDGLVKRCGYVSRLRLQKVVTLGPHLDGFFEGSLRNFENVDEGYFGA
jgi:hypothetical protein